MARSHFAATVVAVASRSCFSGPPKRMWSSSLSNSCNGSGVALTVGLAQTLFPLLSLTQQAVAGRLEKVGPVVAAIQPLGPGKPPLRRADFTPEQPTAGDRPGDSGPNPRADRPEGQCGQGHQDDGHDPAAPARPAPSFLGKYIFLQHRSSFRSDGNAPARDSRNGTEAVPYTRGSVGNALRGVPAGALRPHSLSKLGRLFVTKSSLSSRNTGKSIHLRAPCAQPMPHGRVG